jgi:hypothetical protein
MTPVISQEYRCLLTAASQLRERRMMVKGLALYTELCLEGVNPIFDIGLSAIYNFCQSESGNTWSNPPRKGITVP